MKLLVGTYTSKFGHVNGKGVGLVMLDFANGKFDLTDQKQFRQANPTFAAKYGDSLFAIEESGELNGEILELSWDPATGFEKQATAPCCGTAGCHIAVSPAGDGLAVVNYGTGSVAYYPLHTQKPRLKGQYARFLTNSLPGVTAQPHAHMIYWLDNSTFLVPDLGLDAIFEYAIVNHDLQLGQILKLPQGSGPRHLIFDENKSYFYVLNELAVTLSTCSYSSQKMTLLDTTSVRDPAVPSHVVLAASTVRYSAKTRTLYCGVRGISARHNFVTCLSVGPGPELTPLRYLPVNSLPRDLDIDPTGRYLLVAEQNDDHIACYELLTDGIPGVMTDRVPVASPVSLLWC